VKEQLGHASIRITVDTYGHLIPGTNRNAAEDHGKAMREPPQSVADDSHVTNAAPPQHQTAEKP
jgi:hypothetical protein